jgi:TusA-related sulfurtransferase
MAQLALEVLAGRSVPGRFLALDAAQGLIREGRFSPELQCHCSPEPATMDATTDVTHQACPLTFVQARLALERLPSGGKLRVLLQGDETLRSLSRSFAEEGHRVTSIQPEAAGRYLMIIEKRPSAS